MAIPVLHEILYSLQQIHVRAHAAKPKRHLKEKEST